MKAFLTSFLYAIRGIAHAVIKERNMKIHLAFSLVAVVIGFWIPLSQTEWGFVVFAIFLVLVSEMANTAVERLSDFVCQKEFSPDIESIKNISAGAVLLSAIGAIVIGIVFLVIPAVRKVWGL